jgi:hypothetical protein
MASIDQRRESDDSATGVVELAKRYFELLYSSNLELFDAVFDSQAQLYGLAEGAPVVWPAAKYRAIIQGRPSPQSLGAKREEQIIVLDFVSDTQAFAKVRVRINEMVFIDYLTALKLAAGWRIVSKTYHLLKE